MSKNINGLSEAQAEFKDTIAFGSRLAETADSQGGWASYFDEKSNLGIEDPIKRAHTAIMLENARRWMNSMDESTLSASVGGYRDFVYPIIRASFPNNPILDLVSVQPQTRKNGTIYWMNYIIGQTRGAFKRGETLFDANNGWNGRVGYTDERVYGDSVGTVVAAAAQTAQTSEFPIRAGTLELTIVDGANTYLLRDDGNGGFVIADNGGGAKTLSSSSINYNTGAIALTFSAALAASGAIVSDYENDAEGNDIKAQVDVEMQSAGVTAIRRAIAMRISMESMHDFNQEFGMDLSQTIISAAAQQILADVGGEVVRDLWSMSGGAAASFSLAVPSGINRAEHFRDINYEIEIASGAINDATQRGEATWMIVDQNASNVFKTAGEQAGFVAAPDTNKGQGLVFIGTYNGKKVFKYKYLSTFPGASALGNILLGYKGEDWWDTGYVHAPYQQFYTNGPDERSDLTKRQAFAMRYAKKRINSSMYKRVALAA